MHASSLVEGRGYATRLLTILLYKLYTLLYNRDFEQLHPTTRVNMRQVTLSATLRGDY